jgi:hypothetical protein
LAFHPGKSSPNLPRDESKIHGLLVSINLAQG